MKHYRILNEVMFWLSIVAAATHFLWCALDNRHVFDLQSLLLNVIPYGLPILVFSLVRRELKKESPRQKKGDVFLYALFSLIYFIMILHVTIGGFSGKFIDVYFNLPLLYAIPLTLSGLVWLIVRSKPGTGASIVDKILYSLPLAGVAAMIVHCGILCFIEYLFNDAGTGIPVTSAPWWTLPLLFGVLYLIGIALLFALYAVEIAVKKRKTRRRKG